MGTALKELEIINRFQQHAPVDVVGLIRTLGLRYSEAFLDPGISGMLEASGDTYLVTVNHADAETRKRFTAAHELGHYMLHRELIGSGVDDDRMYRSTSVGKYFNTAIGRTEETQANRFAANLLMPQSLIARFSGGRLKTSELARELAKVFVVSEQAMSIRLGLQTRAQRELA